MENLKYKEAYSRNLPHFQPEGSIFAITFRLAFSLPAKTKRRLKEEKREYDRISKNLSGSELQAYTNEFDKKYFEEFDNFLDKYSKSPMWLSIDEIAQEVANSIHFQEHKLYILHAYCIMPNHVHMIIQPQKSQGEDFYSIAKILYSLKRYTANSCNKILKRNGQFWQHENYDHFVRDEKDLAYQIYYLLYNPVKAKLIDKTQNWKYTWTKDEYNVDIF